MAPFLLRPGDTCSSQLQPQQRRQLLMGNRPSAGGRAEPCHTSHQHHSLCTRAVATPLIQQCSIADSSRGLETHVQHDLVAPLGHVGIDATEILNTGLDASSAHKQGGRNGRQPTAKQKAATSPSGLNGNGASPNTSHTTHGQNVSSSTPLHPASRPSTGTVATDQTSPQQPAGPSSSSSSSSSTASDSSSNISSKVGPGGGAAALARSRRLQALLAAAMQSAANSTAAAPNPAGAAAQPAAAAPPGPAAARGKGAAAGEQVPPKQKGRRGRAAGLVTFEEAVAASANGRHPSLAGRKKKDNLPFRTLRAKSGKCISVSIWVGGHNIHLYSNLPNTPEGFKDAQDLQARYLAYASDPAACQGLDPRVMNRINAKLGRPLVYDPEAYSMRRNPLSTRTHLPIGVHWQKHKQGVISHLVVPPGKAGTGKRTIVCLRVHPATPEGIQEAMENHQRYRAYAEDQSQCAGLDPKVTCRIDTLLHRTPALEVPARIASLKHCRHTLARELPKGVYRRSRVKGFVIAQLIIAGVKVKQTVYLGRFPDNPEGWKLAGESYLRAQEYADDPSKPTTLNDRVRLYINRGLAARERQIAQEQAQVAAAKEAAALEAAAAGEGNTSGEEAATREAATHEASAAGKSPTAVVPETNLAALVELHSAHNPSPRATANSRAGLLVH
ncbi:hypothetical protein V8C86DRAFT_1390522 [Haematococcus lacustris]